MKAIRVRDDDNSLEWTETPRPKPGPGEVLVEMVATSCNRADLLQRRGLYHPPEGTSEILGLDAAGVVAEVGEDVDRFSPGDEVCALLAGGGYAEYATAAAPLVLPAPESIELAEAAALPEVFVTAFLNIFLEADHRPEDSVLVHAAASGVGTAAVQLCNAAGSTVYGTASKPKLEALQQLGIDAAIDRKNEDFSARIDGLTDHDGVDIILDPVGADYFPRNLHLLNNQGRLVVIGLLGGDESEISLGRLLMKRLRVIGSVLRSRSLDEKTEIMEQFRQRVWPMFDEDRLRPVIDQVLPIQEAEHAHELMLDNATTGKVVLTIGQD